MAEIMSGEFLRFLQRASALHGTCDLSDRELLERFLSNRDEGAFTFLVRRHGPILFSVCRRLLDNSHDAEDALQAAFLVLVRRTRSIRRKESVGSWLFGVAEHIALKTRARDAARRNRERETGILRSARPADDISKQELYTALDEAIGSLPEKYRAPIILCYLEGRSMDQAARELNCPKTSLARLLEKGREMLRGKLERRGFTLAALALTTALTEMAAAAPLPVSLTIKTVKAATLVATSKVVAGGYISAHVLALADGAIKGVFVMKAKLVLLAVTFGLAVGGAGWYGYKGYSATSQSSPTAKARPGATKEQKGDPAQNDAQVPSKGEGELVAGIVVDEAGKPMAGAEVEFKKYPAPVRAVSKENGTFQMRMEELPTSGLFYVKSGDGKRLASLRLGDADKKIDLRALRFELKLARILEVTVTDAKGQPVAGARAGVIMYLSLVAQALTDSQGRALLPVPPDDAINHLYAFKPGAGLDYRSFEKAKGKSDSNAKAPPVPTTAIPLRLEGARTVRVTILDGDKKPIGNLPIYPWLFRKPGETTAFNVAGAIGEFTSTTDDAGVAVWDWIPQWQKGITTFWSKSEEYEYRQMDLEPEMGDTAQFILNRLGWLRGRVTYPNGDPAPGITIRVAFVGLGPSAGKTGADGKYEIRVPTKQLVLAVVADDKWAGKQQADFTVLAKYPETEKNFVLRPATIITGKLTVGDDHKPYPRQTISLILHSPPDDSPAVTEGNISGKKPAIKKLQVKMEGGVLKIQQPAPTPSLLYYNTTDQAGHFEFHVGPGNYTLSYTVPASSGKPARINVTDQAKLEVDLHHVRVVPAEKKQGSLNVLVVKGTPAEPAAGALLWGFNLGPKKGILGGFGNVQTDDQGRHEMKRQVEANVASKPGGDFERVPVSMILFAMSADRKFAGFMEVGPETAAVTLPLVPVGSARGRLLAGATGEPLANQEIEYRIKPAVAFQGPAFKDAPFMKFVIGKAMTDAEGRFELLRLIPGRGYIVSVTTETEKSTPIIPSLMAKSGETLELGDDDLRSTKERPDDG